MAIFDTDSQCYFEFNIELFAANSGEADTKVADLLKRLFSPAINSLLEQVSKTPTTLTGSDVTGSNYRYEFILNMKMGDEAHTDYVSFSASDAASARAVLDVNAQRVTGITKYPERINYLKAE